MSASEGEAITAVAVYTATELHISAGEYVETISVKHIENNFDALTHFPDRRARLELSSLAGRIEQFAEHVAGLIGRGGAVELDTVERFARRHVELTRNLWAAESRCMSWFIVGPARFPTSINAKRQASRDNAATEVRDHLDAATKAVSRKAFPHGEPGGPIRANNPHAMELLRTEIEARQKAHAAMKAANAAIRKAGTDETAISSAVTAATGWDSETVAKVIKRDYMGRRGFQSFELSGELAEIARLEQRLTTLTRMQEHGTVATKHDTQLGRVEVIENAEAARIQIIFPDKPDEATRQLLKSRGFRWAPSAGAWQRHLNDNGRHAAAQVLKQIAGSEIGQ